MHGTPCLHKRKIAHLRSAEDTMGPAGCQYPAHTGPGRLVLLVNAEGIIVLNQQNTSSVVPLHSIKIFYNFIPDGTNQRCSQEKKHENDPLKRVGIDKPVMETINHIRSFFEKLTVGSIWRK